MSDSEALINKYRPKTLDEVIGHGAIIKSLRKVIESKNVRTFLFTGPSGVGKTSLARIMSCELGCRSEDLLDIDAATKTGIDDMREVTAGLDYRPLGEGTVKAIIVDEVHALGKAAVQSLLKSLEEPPPWVLWFLCTTEPAKMPVAIKTRAMHCALKAVKVEDLIDYLDKIAAYESILKEGKLRDDVVELCAVEAGGSPRQAISNLVACASANSLEEAQGLLQSVEGSTEAIELARVLIKRESWSTVQKLLGKLKDTNPESIRHIIRAYMTTVILGAKNENSAGRALEILDAFSEPLNSQDGLSPIVLACGKVLLS